MAKMNFSKRLLQHVEQDPQKVCIHLLAQGVDTPISYQMLLENSTPVQEKLTSIGIKPGEVVLLILEHGNDLLRSFFGCILQGAVPSIMPFLTEKLLPERYRADLAALIAVTQPAAILTYAEFEGEIRQALRPDDSVREVVCLESIPALAKNGAPVFPGLQCDAEDIVLLQHSSGTTGLQKGVALSHRAVFSQLDAYASTIKINPQDVIVSWLPLYHDMGLIAGFIMPVLMGIPLVMMSPFEWVRAPYKLLRAVHEYQGTITWLPNFAYHFCAQKIRDRQIEGVDLSSWRLIINCSEPMRWESHKIFSERFKPYGLNENALATCYAMAENVFAVTQGGVEDQARVDWIEREKLQTDNLAVPDQQSGHSIAMLSAGKPIDGVLVKICDPEGGTLPERKIGEIAIRSGCMLTGYYHRPDATTEAIREGWFFSGDYGYLADGELYITGRKKEVIIVGGKNIYPQDLEYLAYQVPGVHAGRAVAFGVFNEQIGTEDVILVAEVDTADAQERNRIADEVRQVVTRGSAVSLRQVVLVDAQWLIKTSSGKNARLTNKQKYLQEFAKIQQ